MHVRIELAVGVDLRESFLREQVGKRTVHEADAFLELRFLVLFRGVQRPAEIVEDRQQFLDETFARALDQGSGLACVALAVVVELRREPLQAVEQLVALGLESLDVGCTFRHFGGSRGNLPVPPNPLHRTAIAVGRLRRRADLLLRSVCHGYAFGASSGSSITS